MKILVISQYYYPEQFRINDICEELRKKGHDITVLSGIPNYPEGKIYSGYENRFRECHNGINIYRCNNRPRYSGTLNLMRNYISFVRCANKYISTMDDIYDCVFVYELSPITMAIPAVKYKKKYKKPVYLYCLDIWPESVRDLGNRKPMSLYNPIYLIAKGISKWILKNVDLIGVKCPEFIGYLKQVCDVPANKIVTLYEHAESVYLSVKETVEKNNCYNFMFLGNIGVSQICETIVEAASKIASTKEFKIHFVGDGSCIENLKQCVIDYKMEDRVRFWGRHPVSEITKFYEMADCCLLTLSDNSMSGLTLPGKLTSYMAAGKPVIAAASGASKEIIAEAQCGNCVKPYDIEALAKVMQDAMENVDIYTQYGRNGRLYFMEHFTIDMFIEKLTAQLEGLVN